MTTPTTTRRGCSPWTLTGCGCGLVAMLGILGVFLLLGLQRARELRDPTASVQQRARCEQNLAHISRALQRYQQDHQALPPALDALSPQYLTTEFLHCPLEAHTGVAYAYTPEVSDPHGALITCTNHGGRPVVLRRDFRVLP